MMGEFDKKLSNWVSMQRTCFKKGKMDQERKRMLDEIGLDFAPKRGRKSKEGRRLGEGNWNLPFEKLGEF
jgi:hypothetical protein